MGWMIFLAEEKDIGNGCACCRFRRREKCMADERVDIHDRKEPEKINRFRPYHCPFRYFDSRILAVTDRFHGMTKEETTGYIKGADHEHQRYIRLEEERSRMVGADARERKIQKKLQKEERLSDD